MLKILGCALIIGAFGSGGMVAAAYFRRQVAVLESFLRVVSSIGARIGFCLTPLEEIFSELDDQQLAGFLEEARQIGAGKAFENCREQQYLSDSEKNLLGTFFRELGTRSAGEEKTNCDYVSDRLSAALESRRAELPKKTKLSRSLCFLTGIMITIMLY